MKLFEKRHQAFVTDSSLPKTLTDCLEFTAVEQYKLLRTNLAFTFPEGTSCPIVGVTSAIRGEGKSTTSINLSYVVAEKRNRVLLIDGDLRLPSVAKKLNISQTPGLTDLLMNKVTDMECFRSKIRENWYVVPSGEIPPNPSELLGSHRMEALLDSLREQFDYIVIDLPPVNLVSDALSVSRFLTGMLLVIREEYSEKKELDACFRQLKLANVKLLGCTMNSAGVGGNHYGKYGKRDRYHYASDHASGKQAKKE